MIFTERHGKYSIGAFVLKSDSPDLCETTLRQRVKELLEVLTPEEKRIYRKNLIEKRKHHVKEKSKPAASSHPPQSQET